MQIPQSISLTSSGTVGNVVFSNGEEQSTQNGQEEMRGKNNIVMK